MDFEEGYSDKNAYRRRKATRNKVDVLQIGKHLAQSSNGLFSPEDWQCRKCGNVNWARRYKCNVCREAKYPKVEARTGLGGGYQDRGPVEYLERESDEEYDLFGRRRRKRKSGGTEEGIAPADLEGEDDDEDGEEMGDLSKYDLADWEEETQTEGMENEESS